MGIIVYIGERWNVKTLCGQSEAKAIIQWVLYDQGRRVEYRRWLDTAVVPPVKYADTFYYLIMERGEILEFGLWG